MVIFDCLCLGISFQNTQIMTSWQVLIKWSAGEGKEKLINASCGGINASINIWIPYANRAYSLEENVNTFSEVHNSAQNQNDSANNGLAITWCYEEKGTWVFGVRPRMRMPFW